MNVYREVASSVPKVKELGDKLYDFSSGVAESMTIIPLALKELAISIKDFVNEKTRANTEPVQNIT